MSGGAALDREAAMKLGVAQLRAELQRFVALHSLFPTPLSRCGTRCTRGAFPCAFVVPSFDVEQSWR